MFMCVYVCVHVFVSIFGMLMKVMCLFSDLSLNSKKKLKIEDYELTSVNN